MIRTVILDDEHIIRMGIAKIIRENLPEYEIVAYFSDGKECLSFLEQDQVDLVISDIRMPFLDGLELLHLARERGWETEFLLISGYDDFEYCKAALRGRAVDYLLKPIDKNEFIQTLTTFAEQHMGQQPLESGPEDKKVIREIKQYLKQHYNERISLDSLAEQFYLSPNYICQLFKVETGSTLTNYINQIRMKKACQYLREPSRRINEIAELLGYRSSQQFSVAFKKVMGKTPREYREDS